MEWLNLYSLLAAAVAVILATVYWYSWSLKKKDEYWKSRGIPYLPNMGLLALYKEVKSQKIHLQQLRDYKKYGRVYGGLHMGNPSIFIGDPEILKDILIKNFQSFHFRRDFDFGDKTFNNMIIALKNEDWKRVRTLITPVFTTKRLKMMTNIMNECSQNVLDEFEKSLKKDGVNDVRRLFGAYTMDVIARSVFATKINSLNDPGNPFLNHAKDFFGKFSLKTFILFFVVPSCIRTRLNLSVFGSSEFFKDVILTVIKERRRKGKRYNDLLQLLMDSLDEDIKENAKNEILNFEAIEDEADQYGSIIHEEINPNIKYKKLSEDELISQCILFFTVGYETTATTIAYTAYLLALNPICQEKLIEEIDNAFEIHNEMNYDAIRDLKYLDCVVSETLRMYPILLVTERTAAEDYELKEIGLTLEKNVTVGVPIYAMHHDPEFFEEPEKFKPERFIEMNHPQYAYLPFGAGPRNCLGMRFALIEIKMVLCNVLRHYKLLLAPSTKVPLDFKVNSGLLSVEDLPLKVEKRPTFNA